MECQVAGLQVLSMATNSQSEPTIRWLRDGVRLAEDVMTSVSGDKLALEVSSCTIVDSGEYMCMLSSGITKVWTSCKLTVEPVHGMFIKI